MKKLKVVFWVIVLGFLALIIFQNQDFFMTKHSLVINLYFSKYFTPELHNAILFLAFFFAGLLIAYFFSLFPQFKANKTIKNQNVTISTQEQQLNNLKMEVEALKNAATATHTDEPVEVSAEPDGVPGQ
jgi:hypothetical protein